MLQDIKWCLQQPGKFLCLWLLRAIPQASFNFTLMNSMLSFKQLPLNHSAAEYPDFVFSFFSL